MNFSPKMPEAEMLYGIKVTAQSSKESMVLKAKIALIFFFHFPPFFHDLPGNMSVGMQDTVLLSSKERKQSYDFCGA